MRAAAGEPPLQPDYSASAEGDFGKRWKSSGAAVAARDAHRPTLDVGMFRTILADMAKQERTAAEIALERIEKARRTGARELDLSELGLTTLPPEIGSLA